MYKRVWFEAALRIIALILSTGLASAQNSRCKVEMPTGDVWVTCEQGVHVPRHAVAPNTDEDVKSPSRKVSPLPDADAPETKIITPSEQESDHTGNIRWPGSTSGKNSSTHHARRSRSVSQQYVLRITLYRVHYLRDIHHRYRHVRPRVRSLDRNSYRSGCGRTNEQPSANEHDQSMRVAPAELR
jgi:hypothetical protein